MSARRPRPLAPDLPTGPIIVLIAAGLFTLSLLLAPVRGVLASVLSHRRFQARVHRRQGLLALVRNEPIHDPLTLRILRAEGLIRPDGVATDEGRALAAKIARRRTPAGTWRARCIKTPA